MPDDSLKLPRPAFLTRSPPAPLAEVAAGQRRVVVVRGTASRSGLKGAAAAGAVGFLVGGPLGAAVGAAAGGYFTRARPADGIHVVAPEQAGEIKTKYGERVEPGSAYVLHPTSDSLYLPMETFHPRLFQEKAQELLRLLQSLGAKEVYVEHEFGLGDGMSFGFNGPIPTKAGKVMADVKARGAHMQRGHVVQHERFDPPGHPPSVPMGLAWLDTEIEWQGLVARRLSGGLRTFHVALTYADDFGVGVDLEAKLKRVKVSLGANYRRFRRSRMLYRGEFY